MGLKKTMDRFATLCNETVGASFTVTRQKKSGKWQVSILNKLGAHFFDDDLEVAINKAYCYVSTERKKVQETIVKFTLYET